MGGIARIQVQKALEAILEWWRPSRRVSTMDCEQFGRTAVLNGDFTHMPRSFFQNRTLIWSHVYAWLLGLPWWLSSKESTCQCRRHGFYPWVRKIPWRRKGNLFQYSCLENPMDRGAWQATVHGITKSWTWLSSWTTIISKHEHNTILVMINYQDS